MAKKSQFYQNDKSTYKNYEKVGNEESKQIIPTKVNQDFFQKNIAANERASILSIEQLNEEINSYVDFIFIDKSGEKSSKVQLPYRSAGKDGGGKGKWSIEELNRNIIRLDVEADSPYLQSVINENSHMTGIDGSGFVLRVINAATKGRAVNYYKETFNILAEDILKWGLSLGDITSKDCSKKIQRFSDIRPGDYICFNKGEHAAVIYNITGDTIYYAHSSAGKGPHRGSVKVSETGKLNLNLAEEGIFYDSDKKYSDFMRSIFSYISRPNFLIFTRK